MNIDLFGVMFLCLEVIIIAILTFNMIVKRKIIDKNSFVYMGLVFVLVWAMYSYALSYNSFIQQTPVGVLNYLALIKETLKAFVFEFNVELISTVMNLSFINTLAYVIMIVLSTFTTVLGLLTLVSKAYKNIKNIRGVYRKNGDIILGVSQDSKKYNKLNNNTMIWDDIVDKNEYKQLINSGHTVLTDKLTAKMIAFALRKGVHHLILFKDSPYTYSKILDIFKEVTIQKTNKLNKNLQKDKNNYLKQIKKSNPQATDAELDKLFKEKYDKILKEKYNKIKSNNSIYLHIEASIEEIEAIKAELTCFEGSNLNSYVMCFNKYQNLAINFVKDYPISADMPRDFFNKNYSLKDDKNVNVVFVGFGNVNYELFKMMAIEFQFAKQKKAKKGYCQFANHPVNYYVYDNNEDRLCNDYFTKLDYEFNNDFKNTTIPKMEKICNLKHERVNVYSSEFKQSIENLITENSYTYIIVSLQSDLQNIAYAESLQGYLADEKNFKIFTRVKENVFYEKENAKRGIVYFGEEDNLYLHNTVTNKDLLVLAQSIKSQHAIKTTNAQYYEWSNLILMHQYSKIYLALSMFFKVGLMGYKLLPNQPEVKGESIDTFIQDYSHKTLDEIKNDYNLFFENLASNTMSFIEHSRWNAHYYFSGYKPMQLSEFAPTKQREMQKPNINGIIKRHSSLTSYDGLNILFKYLYLMKKYGADYVEHDINEVTDSQLNSEEFRKVEQYSYDYRLLDFVQNLSSQNYLLVKNKKQM